MIASRRRWEGIEADIKAVRNGVASPEQQKHVGAWIATHLPSEPHPTPAEGGNWKLELEAACILLCGPVSGEAMDRARQHIHRAASFMGPVSTTPVGRAAKPMGEEGDSLDTLLDEFGDAAVECARDGADDDTTVDTLGERYVRARQALRATLRPMAGDRDVVAVVALPGETQDLTRDDARKMAAILLRLAGDDTTATGDVARHKAVQDDSVFRVAQRDGWALIGAAVRSAAPTGERAGGARSANVVGKCMTCGGAGEVETGQTAVCVECDGTGLWFRRAPGAAPVAAPRGTEGPADA
jgi:hypothetical protein